MERIKYEEQRQVGNDTVTLQYIESMSYQGVWEFKGYRCFLKGIQFAEFYAYPTESDFKRALP